ncbi:MAG: restriction endonuclease subunit M [Anaerolinea sp.]|nr:restriction endonuclease subunit M [Anaerolinea sp.]
MSDNFLSIDEAVEFVNEVFKKNISQGNISYLIKYGQVHKHENNGTAYIDKHEIREYYENAQKNEADWKSKVGDNLNWELSFNDIKEYERTKHVHRLHPYKGKFIPQLVEYFLDEHTNGLKKEIFFTPGDIVIDPFCGSGTTLVQANELGLNAIGIDISEFNTLISNIKVGTHDLLTLQTIINQITKNLKVNIENNSWQIFDIELGRIISGFNKTNFPTPEILYRIKSGEINLNIYSNIKIKEINVEYSNLLKKNGLIINEANSNGSFINKWFTPPVKQEIIFLLDQINKVKNEEIKNVLRLILSRTSRSCRATTHSDLATLLEPVLNPYYCYKHNKICKPLFTLSYWWEFYANDTVKRLDQFSKLKTDSYQICITGDSKTISLYDMLKKENPTLVEKLLHQKAKGIFTSPPYVGLIDYHEQHAYAYELFNISRRDDFEIGPQSMGKGKSSRDKYVVDISEVLLNTKGYLIDDCEIFIVANDSFNLYPIIAEKSGLQIVEEFKRPVLNRTEKDKSAYSEKIFRLKRM